MDHRKRDSRCVERMFSGIARRYDLLNHVLSFGLDFKWRRRVSEETTKVACQKILDVCTGTGDMAIELCRFWKGNARIEGIDFSRELIEIGKEKIRKAHMDDKITFIEGNAENLPYADEQFDAITITFGLRNISDRLKALREFHRVTRPGGCLVCLEFSQPANPLFARLYFFYLIKIVPYISRIIGSDPGAYRYLGNTIKEFPPPHELADLIESAGWKNVAYRFMTGGIVAMHRGEKN
ncbi:MAG: bifunctional demethylmenaquinone methyltransferase/2-methoxy-6-polyprenyl-1,4-benzoquinol methylase UbiE [Nitrospirota bacterium]